MNAKKPQCERQDRRECLVGDRVNLTDLRAWKIVVAQDAIPSERYAALELQTFYLQAGGTKLPIVSACKCPDSHILIGPGAALQWGGPEWETARFQSEELRIVAGRGVIAISGGRPRGTLYGVYVFLEDYLGVRFLAPDCTHVPRLKAKLFIGPLDRRYHSPFALRWSYCHDANNDPVMATRQRTNAVQTDLTAIHRSFMRKPPIAQDGRPFINDDPRFGGVSNIQLVGHSFFEMLPAAEFSRSNPEYFSEIDGKRRALPALASIENWQPCLSSPDVLRIVTERVMAQLAADPGMKFATVSQNDGSYYCRCKACRAIDEREGTPMGSLLTFVNAVADAVAGKHPDVLVGTLAYGYSWKPPLTLKARSNVFVQLCSFQCCTLHSLDDPECPLNKPFREHLVAWGEVAGHIGIWNYQTNFSSYLSPCPNLRALQENIRFFAAHHVDGVFMQAVYDTPGGEMSDLRNYLIGAMLWDPTRDARTWMDEFLDLFYGQSAVPIRTWLDRLHDHVAQKNVHATCYGYNREFGLDDTLIRFGLQCFDAALRQADNHVIRARVEKASLSIYRAAIDPLLHDNESLDPFLVKKLAPLARRFFALCRKYRVMKLRECSLSEWRPAAAEIRQMEYLMDEIRRKTGLDLSDLW